MVLMKRLVECSGTVAKLGVDSHFPPWNDDGHLRYVAHVGPSKEPLKNGSHPHVTLPSDLVECAAVTWLLREFYPQDLTAFADQSTQNNQ